MAEIVNLRLARKRKAEAEKQAEAAGNRAAFGRPKRERKLTEAERRRETKKLDGHKLDD
jgi:hypothetical protein